LYYKTGVIFSFGCAGVASLAGMNKGMVDKMFDIGSSLGIAFQVKDDS